MTDTNFDANQNPPESEVKTEVLPDLGDKYKLQKYLGSGANDKAYTVTRTEDGEVFVALSPIVIFSQSSWEKTKNKCDKADILAKIEGIDPYLVHEVDRGTLFLSNKPGTGSYGKQNEPDKVVVVEHGGKPIDGASEEVRIRLLPQMWDVVKRLNRGGRVITDFKADHFTYSGSDEDPHLRIIDYTGIIKTDPDPAKRRFHDDPITNTWNFLSFAQGLFPWFSIDKDRPDSKDYEDHVAYVDKNLEKLFQQEKSLPPFRKRWQSLVNEVRSRL